MIHTIQNEKAAAIRARALPDRMEAHHVLSALKRAVLDCTTAALEASGSELRRMFERLAGEAMRSYEQLFEIMRQNRLYPDAPAASVQDVQAVQERCMDAVNSTGQQPVDTGAGRAQAPIRTNPWQPSYYSFMQQPQPIQQPGAAPLPYGFSRTPAPFGGGNGTVFSSAPPVAPPRMPEFAQPHAFPFGGMPQAHYTQYQSPFAAAGAAPQHNSYAGAHNAVRTHAEPQVPFGGAAGGTSPYLGGTAAAEAPLFEEKQADAIPAAEAKTAADDAKEAPAASAVKRTRRAKTASEPPAAKEEQETAQL
ncbi:spore coat protein [Paenibacillus thermotolerans]|uniref:spore coat protein n=1 Tax=Paenibacillus thermotolerans TaxID=3027807 RepID=UPI002367CF5E|nr:MULTISPECIES: spore coat protein [unclassified Paenibacillus]